MGKNTPLFGLIGLLLWVVLGSVPVWAQITVAAPTAMVISAQDQAQILRDARLRRVGDHYVATGCDDPLQVALEAVDLNGDGMPEAVLKVTGSPCFSGAMHSNVSVYVRSSQGRWREVLGFLPAFSLRVLPSSNRGYADLALTVLGGCDPVYRWIGSSYIYARKISGYGNERCQ